MHDSSVVMEDFSSSSEEVMCGNITALEDQEFTFGFGDGGEAIGEGE
jgi:hypothetical protein